MRWTQVRQSLLRAVALTTRGPAWAGLGLLLLLGATASSAAAPKRVALLFGNSTYPALPEQPSCATSVGALAGALRRAGFEVTERLNPSNGQMGAAITDFTKTAGASGDAVAVAYFCGYASSLQSRLFLLPASANLQRETDALSQGIVSRQFVRAVQHAGVRAGALLVDTFAVPGSTLPLPLSGMVEPASLGGIGFAAVQTQGQGPSGPTELAAVAAAVLAKAGDDWPGAFKSLRAKLPDAKLRRVVIFDPTTGAPTPAAAVARPAPPPQANAQPGGPEAASLGPADVRRLQLAMQKLGYYAGVVDGVVGPDTLAAIRRYQHELRAPMTGQLTTEQAERLLKDSL